MKLELAPFDGKDECLFHVDQVLTRPVGRISCEGNFWYYYGQDDILVMCGCLTRDWQAEAKAKIASYLQRKSLTLKVNA